ncbi:hypothetical protein [Acuticoccus mangrovi]|uniref:Uncharacterized protein n=1 Tax=Acuticoccus mangrovi TaxID=2796142 RepID=A0A934IQL5_9HYPH|nr:hypothetical protein [Acuticoccus mangrovi]MBJ3776250.1 hypothetical protein [Acuticoccus mangrovi]
MTHTPKVYYFPTSDPDVWIVCDYNPADGAYNANCRKVKTQQLPQRLVIEARRFHNAIIKYA